MKFSQKLTVKFHYDIYFTENIFDKRNNILQKVLKEDKPKVLIFVDSGVIAKHPTLLPQIAAWSKRNLKSFTLVAVRGSENLKKNSSLWKKIASDIRYNGLDRHSYVLIIGGGAVLDTIGFIASISHRGIRQIRIPTTALSQCDSGVGVKNGVNYYGVKNYFGTFEPPVAVINDSAFLKTLDGRSWSSGIAEAYKVAIVKDINLLRFLIKNSGKVKKCDLDIMKTVVKRSALLHARHIANSNDPFEKGSERPLDFGHWSAHYLETMTGYRLCHGEAVSIGVALDMAIAKNRKLVSKKDYYQVYQGLKQSGCLLWDKALNKRVKSGQLEIYKGLEEFRLHLGGRLNIILPRGLGNKTLVHKISYQEVERAVLELGNASKQK